MAGVFGCLEPTQHVKTIHLRHDEIEQNQVEFLARDELQRRGAIGGGHGLMALARESTRKHVAIGGIVVDDQNST